MSDVEVAKLAEQSPLGLGIARVELPHTLAARLPQGKVGVASSRSSKTSPRELSRRHPRDRHVYRMAIGSLLKINLNLFFKFTHFVEESELVPSAPTKTTSHPDFEASS